MTVNMLSLLLQNMKKVKLKDEAQSAQGHIAGRAAELGFEYRHFVPKDRGCNHHTGLQVCASVAWADK